MESSIYVPPSSWKGEGLWEKSMKSVCNYAEYYLFAFKKIGCESTELSVDTLINMSTTKIIT